MTIIQNEGASRVSSVAFSCLKDSLKSYGSDLTLEAERALQSVLQTMADMLFGSPSKPTYHLASLPPGAGKTEALCAFLKAWKAAGFIPANGALIVLSTRQEIASAISRSGLQACDFAVLVKKDHPLNGLGSALPATAPVLFTTQEKLRRECAGQSFADTAAFHFRGHARALRIWDEAFLPATPEMIRRDIMVQPLADLRLVSPIAAASLESISDSLGADRVGEVVEVPTSAVDVQRALKRLLGPIASEPWAPLAALAGREAVVVNCNGRGLHLAGASQHLPADFAPALILDASGRVRETYRTLEAAGLLERLPGIEPDYSRLRVHHWGRAASRSALSDAKARREVLEAAAEVINADNDPWLVIHAQDRQGAGYSVTEDLRDLVVNPDRLSFVHWGNHHGTNDYRAIGKVLVLGLWQFPQPAYSAFHLAACGRPEQATARATLEAVKTGEHRHHLLQAICRASVRSGGDCEVYLVGRLGSEGRELLLETFPGAMVDDWTPAGRELSGSALRVSQELERLLAVPGVHAIQKGALRASLGFKSSEALAKVIRREDFKAWAKRQGLTVNARSIERPISLDAQCADR